MLTASWSLLAVECSVRVLVAAANRGLAPHADLPRLVEVDSAQRHEELRPGGVEASLVVEGDGVRYHVTTISLGITTVSHLAMVTAMGVIISQGGPGGKIRDFQFMGFQIFVGKNSLVPVSTFWSLSF